MQKLPDQRAQCATRGDDWPLSAKGSTGTDGDRSRHGLEQHHAGGDSAFATKYPFHHFGDAVPANRRRAEPRHQADDQSADDRNYQQRQRAAVRRSRRDERGRDSPVKRDVGGKRDESDEGLSDEAPGNPDDSREAGDDYSAPVYDVVLARSTDGIGRNILRSLDRRGQIGRKRKHPLFARSVA